MKAQRLSGESGGSILIATNGVRTETVDEVPEWATLFWYLRGDPKARADWSSLRGYSYTPPNKLSKSNV